MKSPIPTILVFFTVFGATLYLILQVLPAKAWAPLKPLPKLSGSVSNSMVIGQGESIVCPAGKPCHYAILPDDCIPSAQALRDEFMRLNDRMRELFRQARLSNPKLVNVGHELCDAAGDTLPYAILKINDDLDRLAPYVLSEAP